MSPETKIGAFLGNGPVSIRHPHHRLVLRVGEPDGEAVSVTSDIEEASGEGLRRGDENVSLN